MENINYVNSNVNGEIPEGKLTTSTQYIIEDLSVGESQRMLLSDRISILRDVLCSNVYIDFDDEVVKKDLKKHLYELTLEYIGKKIK